MTKVPEWRSAVQKYPVGEGREGGRETGLKWGLEGPCNCPGKKSWELAFEKKREIQHWKAVSA